MDRSWVACLHYITPMNNLTSIRQHGLVCHEYAQRVPHESVASAAIQDRRAHKPVPGGLKLHQYVNLYFHARNSMMYVLKSNPCPPLVVLTISSSVLDLPGVVISDGNPAPATTRFYRSPDGLAALDETLVYAHSWNAADYWEKQERKRIRSAEVLVPHRLPPEYIMGAIAENQQQCSALKSLGLAGEVNSNVFFQ